jgi:hypothetical protein
MKCYLLGILCLASPLHAYFPEKSPDFHELMRQPTAEHSSLRTGVVTSHHASGEAVGLLQVDVRHSPAAKVFAVEDPQANADSFVSVEAPKGTSRAVTIFTVVWCALASISIGFFLYSSSSSDEPQASAR